MREWSFAVITDTHVGLDGWATRFGQVRDFIVAHKDEWKIKALFHCGDVWHSPTSESAINEVKNDYLDPLGIDYYIAVGNHDRDENDSPQIIYDIMGSHCPSKYYAVTINHHRFILIGQGYGFHSSPDGGTDEQDFWQQNLTKDYFNISIFHASLIDWEQDIWGNAATDPWFYQIPNASVFLNMIESLGEKHLHFHGHYHGDQWTSPELPEGYTHGVGMGNPDYPHLYQRGVESVWRSHVYPDPNESDGLRRKPWILICHVNGTKIQIEQYNAETGELYLSETLDYYAGRDPCIVKQMKNNLTGYTEEWNGKTETFQAEFQSVPDGMPVYYGDYEKPNRIEGGELVGCAGDVVLVKPSSTTVRLNRK